MSGCWRSRRTGGSNPAPAIPTAPVPRARWNAVSATSSTTPSPAAGSPAGGSRPPSATLAADGGRWPDHANPGRIPRPTLRMGTRTPDPGGSSTPFGAPEDLTRIVSRDCVVALDTNCHSVPWHLVGELVRLSVTIARRVRVYHGIGVGGESCTLHRPPSTPSRGVPLRPAVGDARERVAVPDGPQSGTSAG